MAEFSMRFEQNRVPQGLNEWKISPNTRAELVEASVQGNAESVSNAVSDGSMIMNLRTQLVDLTSKLVAIPSVSAQKCDLDRVIDFIVEHVRDLPDVQLHHTNYNDFPTLTVGFHAVRHADVVLNAHVDVVPARDDQWQTVERDGKLYGRGTQDMKGAAAVYMKIIHDIAAMPADQRPNVLFQFVTDEEIGGANGTAKLRDEGWSANLFIAGEPTDLQICHAAKGILWVEIMQPGVPAHGSRPWEGVNPIERLAHGLRNLLAMYPPPHEPLWRTTISANIVHGGDAGNRIPDKASLRLDVRWTPEEGIEQVLANIEQAFKFDSPPHATISILQQGSSLNTAADHAQVQRIHHAQTLTLGHEPHSFREHFGSDARFYSEMNVPAVCWGPVGSGLHTDDEWVSIDGLVDYYHAVRALLGMR